MSSVEVCVRFAPLVSVERMAAGVKAGRTLYQRGALKFLPGSATCPLLVDHDEGKQIGVVHDLVEWAQVDGPWLVARASVTEAPDWLKRGTKASFDFANLHRQPFDEGERVLRALVREVSVLSPSMRPVEPLAEVVLLQRNSLAAGRPDRRPAAGEVLYGDGTRIRRHFSAPIAVRKGNDLLVHRRDGSTVIYSGAEGYREAVRDGVVGR